MAALNFPGSPSSGDEFEGYVYDATLGVWNRKPNTVAYTVSPAAPTNPNDGDVWFNETDGSSYIYYVDADSEQWVEIGGTVGATGARGENGADGRFINSATKPEEPVDGDMWFNTNTGQIFVYYDDGTTSQWVESGTKVLAYDTLANLSDTNIPSPTDGQALIYNSSTSKWEPGSAAPSGVNTIASDNINIDFSDNVPLETRAIAGDVNFTASNYTAGAKKTIYLEGDTVQRSLTFPAAWNFVGEKPEAIGVSKKNFLDLNSFGTSESTTVALWLGDKVYAAPIATGGAVSEVSIDGITYRLHSFTNVGDSGFVVSENVSNTEFDVLIVAGGGGSGFDLSGGGGGGGVVHLTNALITPSSATITVGDGGDGSGTYYGVAEGNGQNGENSSAFGYIALGGGGSGYQNGNTQGNSGGSGGGSAGGYTSGGGASTQTLVVSGNFGDAIGYGNSGGRCGGTSPDYPAGGGGGAGQPGQGPTSSDTSGGNGGDGIQINIDGNNYYWAGGGGGATHTGGNNAGNGGLGGGGGGSTTSNASGGAGGGQALNSGGPGFTAGDGVFVTPTQMGGANTGGGAGGAHNNNNAGNGAKGGSGIVIIRYPITDPN